MALGDIITFYDGAAWLNRVEGREETFGRHEDKTDAMVAGHARASVAHVKHHVEHESGPGVDGPRRVEPESSGG